MLLAKNVMYNYEVVNKLAQTSVFRNSTNQRCLATTIDVDFSREFCDTGHNIENFREMLIWISINVLSNNFFSKENNIIAASKANGNVCKKKYFQP